MGIHAVQEVKSGGATEGVIELTESETLTRILSNPFAFQSYSAIILLILGLSIAAFAVFEGYHFDDLIPGYGAIHRRYRDAREKKDIKKAKVINDIKDIFTQYITRIESELKEFLDSVVDIRNYHGEFHNMTSFIEDYSKSFQERCEEALTAYRSANEYVRTEAAPQTFLQFSQLGVGPILPTLGEREAELDKLMVHAEQLTERARKAKIEIVQELQRQIDATKAHIDGIEQRILQRMQKEAQRDNIV